MERDENFVEQVVKMLVDHPEDVKVNRSVDEMGVLITLSVHSEDMGMVIGREGSTAKALRTLLRVVGARNNARVNLKINEPEGSERAQREHGAGIATPQQDAPAQDAPAQEMPEHDAPAPGKKTLDEVVGDIQI